jgi:hypothetical protein
MGFMKLGSPLIEIRPIWNILKIFYARLHVILPVSTIFYGSTIRVM